MPYAPSIRGTPNAPLRLIAELTEYARGGIPPQHRRSMEDEARPVPTGWVRQFDLESKHQFFVDMRSETPRSIWVHPYDDRRIRNTLPRHDREPITRRGRRNSLEDMTPEDSNSNGQQNVLETTNSSKPKHATFTTSTTAPTTSPSSDEPHGLRLLRRRITDPVVSRVVHREERFREEKTTYNWHKLARLGFAQALATGEPQFVGKTRQGRDVYIVPPGGAVVPADAHVYNPCVDGPFSMPDARFRRPLKKYYREQGLHHGGGRGLTLLGDSMAGKLSRQLEE